ncbi:MAG TPA: hypothetical protein VFL99_14735 [Segeticoccus sp.]|uniref:hypothetical protein n=1 Tax=Segeticoccus sp. TaxID=2706531 RepID=UPI002D7E21C8|nr:hypothetical protein [Segeticoccus sp.]HET8601581.1 hypothetical protein [Segeticoccus sp.]
MSPDLLLLPARGLGGRGTGRLIRLIYRILFVRFLFHLFGFWGAIGILVAIGLGVFLYSRYRGRR